MQTPEAMRKRYRIDVRTRTEVVAIDRAARQVAIRNLATGEQAVEHYDSLILSPGADPVKPPIPGSDSELVFTLRSLADMDAHQEDDRSRQTDPCADCWRWLHRAGDGGGLPAAAASG